jgi:mRNA-degrading endonuclease toxin of MazEF toxin-antitoxin module
MRRGEIWTASGDTNNVGKPRPVVIVQDDSFDATASITVCAFTTDDTDVRRLDRAMLVFLGLAGPARTTRASTISS